MYIPLYVLSINGFCRDTTWGLERPFCGNVGPDDCHGSPSHGEMKAAMTILLVAMTMTASSGSTARNRAGRATTLGDAEGENHFSPS